MLWSTDRAERRADERGGGASVRATPRDDWEKPLRAAFLGFLNGYLLIHPVAMVIFHSLQESLHGAAGGLPKASVWGTFVESYSPDMLPMAIAFGAIGAVIGLVYSYQGRVIRSQRDRLARQLERETELLRDVQEKSQQLKTNNDQLLELQAIKRRSVNFIVHDMKTQLGCIEGFSALLLDGSQDQSEGEHLDALIRIRRQAFGMLAAVNNLLDIARLEECPTPRREQVVPVDLLRSVVEGMAYWSREFDIVVDPTSQSCPRIMVERDLIWRVVLNLISNATKHNRPGTKVVIGASLDSERRHVVFSCCDNGVGIPTDLLTALFEPFRSGENAAAGSTGLGLAFARSAVEAHNGRIWCESNQGQGTRFYFSLPL